MGAGFQLEYSHGGIPQTGWGIPEALIQEIRQMGGIPESKKGDPPDGGDPRDLQESLQPRATLCFL